MSDPKKIFLVNIVVLIFCTGTMLFAAATLSATCDRIGERSATCKAAHFVGYPVRIAF